MLEGISMTNLQIKVSGESERLYKKIPKGLKKLAFEQAIKLLYESDRRDIFFKDDTFEDDQVLESLPKKRVADKKVSIGWE